MGGIIKTATGATATFSTQLAIPMRSVQVAFSPVQEGSGDPSPTNIRPITGWSGFNLFHTGNSVAPFLADSTTKTGSYNGYSGWSQAWLIPDRTKSYTYSAYIDNTSSSENAHVTTWLRNETDTEYVDGVNVSGSNVPAGSKGWSTVVVNVSAKPNTYYLGFGMTINNATVSHPVVIAGTGSPYTTIPVEFGEDVGTTYGGTVDLTTGVLTEEYVKWDSTMIAEKINQNSSSLYNRGVRFGSNKIVNSATVYANKLKPMKAGNWNTVFTSGDSGSLYTDANYIGIVMDDTGNTTKAEWATWVQNLGLEFVVKQQTPVTYQLTPQQVNALAGLNNVWSDANGDTTVEYLERGVNPLALRRWVLMGQKLSDWRDLYQQVTYLQSSGTQYIDTGATIQQGDKITLSFYMPSNNTTSTWVAWGFRRYSNYSYPNQGYIAQTKEQYRRLAFGVPATTSGVGSETCYPLDVKTCIVIDTYNNTLTVDGNAAQFNYNFANGYAFDSTGSSVYNPYLFTYNDIGSAAANIPNGLKIYEYKVERSGDFAQNFIPCYRKSDNKPGMYDTVSGTFYTNAGTGEFTVGPDFVDTNVKILESGKILQYSGGAYVLADKENGGATILYQMDTPTTILYPAGIIPTSGYVISQNIASIFIYDENETAFSYVNENTGGYNRWAQDESGTLTEFSQSWTASKNYYYIQFSVDTRYLDRAYMYDKTTGQIWFAGKNTPYYGLSNISQA